MWVTVWRHGEAASGAVDEYRALTPRGRKTLLSAVPRFNELCLRAEIPPPDTITFSPLVRTTQTAEILSLGLHVTSMASDELAPGAVVSDTPGYLQSSALHQIIVSHQPFVSELLNYWLDRDDLPPLLPGGFACVDLIAPGRGAAELAFAEPDIF